MPRGHCRRMPAFARTIAMQRGNLHADDRPYCAISIESVGSEREETRLLRAIERPIQIPVLAKVRHERRLIEGRRGRMDHAPSTGQIALRESEHRATVDVEQVAGAQGERT